MAFTTRSRISWLFNFNCETNSAGLMVLDAFSSSLMNRVLSSSDIARRSCNLASFLSMKEGSEASSSCKYSIENIRCPCQHVDLRL